MDTKPIDEIVRTIRTVAVYMEYKDESPLCARDLNIIANILELLWSDNVRLLDENEKLRAVLEQVEYVAHHTCPWCRGSSHKPDCPRQKALGE